jgi:hypothetical protein
MKRVLKKEGMFCRKLKAHAQKAIQKMGPVPILPDASEDIVRKEKSAPYFPAATFIAATWPWRAMSAASARIRAASCGAWKPMEFSAAM